MFENGFGTRHARHFSFSWYVSVLFNEASAAWKKMQNGDKKLTKFLEATQTSDEPICMDDLESHEKVAAELDSGKKELTKKMSVMAGVGKKMAPVTSDEE